LGGLETDQGASKIESRFLKPWSAKEVIRVFY
jgi:hypothetical protein